jgi:hypothetical protein
VPSGSLSYSLLDHAFPEELGDGCEPVAGPLELRKPRLAVGRALASDEREREREREREKGEANGVRKSLGTIVIYLFLNASFYKGAP